MVPVATADLKHASSNVKGVPAPRRRRFDAAKVPVMAPEVLSISSIVAAASRLDNAAIRRFLVLDRLGAAAGVLLVIIGNGLFIKSGELWLVIPAIAVLIGALSLALRLLEHRSVLLPLALAAVGNWFVAIVVSSLLPVLWPVMVLTVLMPLVLATPYLAKQQLIPALVVTGLTTGVVGAIGLLNDDGGVFPDMADEFELILVVSALMAQIAPIAMIVWQNNHHQQRSLELAATLNNELRYSEEQLDASRRRVVLAADTERRRIERDLHDGAQQRLVAIGIWLRLLQDKVTDDPEVGDALTSVVGEVEGAIEEIRELAHGIYPPVLQTRGLGPALSAVARRSPLPVETDLAEIGRLDESLETALYFVALEALTNAAKHAPGSSVRISLTTTGRIVTLTVMDDGPGFDVDAYRASHGSYHMADRLAAVGGDLVMDSTPGAGTSVVAHAPIAEV